MQTWNRRDLLASLGVMSGATLLTGCAGQIPDGPRVSAGEIGESAKEAASPPMTHQASEGIPAPRSGPPQNWTYQPLDPEAVGQIAYAMYPQGSCMYAVFGSVVSLLADQVGEPFRSFPLEMMRFGATGIGGWGSTCGVVNGCAALIGLFHREQGDKRRDERISDICLWYESSLLPKFRPAKPAGVDQVGTAVAGSVLCHLSINQWCKAAGCDAFSAERRERCRRISADGAMKVVELLNSDTNGPPDFLDLTEATHACIECHGKDDRRDSSAKMSCAICHPFERTHP